MKPKINRATKDDQQRWNSYVESQLVENHAYLWEWRQIIETVFKHTPHYLLAEDDNGEIVGVLPLFHVKSLLFGSSLISLPYLNAGGIVTSSNEAYDELLKHAIELANNLRVSYLELRNRHAESRAPDSLSVRSHKSAMILGIDKDSEAVFSEFPAKLRSQIRRPAKSGVYLNEELSEQEKVTSFYEVFSRHMRDLGTPVYPRKLFEEVKKNFADRCSIFITCVESTPIAAGITIGVNSTTEILWASSLYSHNKLSANMLLYWEAIKKSCSDGYQNFDFGRSTPDSGPYRFKKQWGTTPLQLNWYYHGKIPDVNPNNPKYSAMVSLWRKLPLRVANIIGPKLTKGLP